MSQRENILNTAERRMRHSGYNAVSFRDVAADVGIKSASLHYHFPKKADLGLALVQRYAAHFQAALAQQTTASTLPAEKLDVFINLHRDALVKQELLCLCAVFGAEARGLPETVNLAVSEFFTWNVKWLTQTYIDLGAKAPSARAKAAVSILEGALIVANSLDDDSIFEAAAEFVRAG